MEFFLQRREMEIINIGGPAQVAIDGETVSVGSKEALYIGMGARELALSGVGA